MNDHELILLLDRSTAFRLGENRIGSSTPGRLMVSMQFPRSERRSKLGSAASFLTEDNESISLSSSVSADIASDMGADVAVIWFIDADSDVSDGN